VSRARSLLIPLLVAATASVAGGCGDGESTTSTTPLTETAQEFPKLPPGWNAHRDRAIGYAIAVPPGWERSGHAGKVLFRSPDHLVAVTLAVDRNPNAPDLSLGGSRPRRSRPCLDSRRRSSPASRSA